MRVLYSMGHHENETNLDVDASILSELERQKRDLIYKIGLRCISILNYLADNVNALPLSASRRMVVTHDVPWLMADLLNFRPWQRRTKKGLEKYIGTIEKSSKIFSFTIELFQFLRR